MRLFITLLLLSTLPALASDNDNTRMGVIGQTLYSTSTVYSQGVPLNSARAYLLLQNQSAASTVSVSFGGSSTVGFQIQAGSTLQVPFQDSVYLKSSAGVINTLIIEATH